MRVDWTRAIKMPMLATVSRSKSKVRAKAILTLKETNTIWRIAAMTKFDFHFLIRNTGREHEEVLASPRKRVRIKIWINCLQRWITGEIHWVFNA